jgi:hypothetical protein
MRNFSKSIGSGRLFLSAACLLFVLVVTTNAYTVVLRGGKRVEIPAQFTVTTTTLTYEAAPSFFITLQMTAIDIPATERANNETAGSLLGRVAKQQQSVRTAENTRVEGKTRAKRSVTNRDLEAYARARLESDRAYEQTRKELGLPPLAVERAQAAKETEQFWQELERTRVEDEGNARAAELQAQIGALSNQLNYLQATVGERSAFASGAFGGLGGVSSFRSSGRTIIRAPLFGPRFGLPLDVDFVTLNGPFGLRPRFNGLRRNVFVPGVPIRGRVTFGHEPLMPRRFR